MSKVAVTVPSESPDGFAHLTQDRNAKYIRFYLWLYDASPNRINTCKLLWAYLFAPIVLVFRLLFEVVATVLDLLPKRQVDWVARDRQYAIEAEKRRLKAITKKQKGPSRLERWLDAVATKLSAVYVKVAPVIKWAFILVALGVGVAAAVFIVLAIIANPVDALLIVGGTLAFLAVCAGIAALFLATPVGKQVGGFFSFLGSLFKSFHHHTCAKIDLT